MKEKICPACGAVNQAHLSYCYNCFAKLPSDVTAPAAASQPESAMRQAPTPASPTSSPFQAPESHRPTQRPQPESHEPPRHAPQAPPTPDELAEDEVEAVTERDPQEVDSEKQLYSTISVRNLVKVYKSRRVVDNVSFHMHRGEIVGLLGPNGAGKTTTFYQVVGLVSPDSGQVYLNDRDITRLPMYRRARLGIGYLAQEDSVFRKMSVEDNITSILELFVEDRFERRQRCEQLLEDLEIAHIRASMAFTLSGGERRRTEIARALASSPNFLLLDEPFAGVDPLAVEDIQQIIMKLKTQNNIGILITDHNARETLRITDRSYILAKGQIRFQGSAEDLANSPEARRLYLGANFRL